MCKEAEGLVSNNMMLQQQQRALTQTEAITQRAGFLVDTVGGRLLIMANCVCVFELEQD